MIWMLGDKNVIEVFIIIRRGGVIRETLSRPTQKCAGGVTPVALHRYTPQQLYDVVANVDQYQHFVPWCAKSQAFKGESGDFQAELEIGFPPVVERYTSEVTVIPNHKIRVSVWKIIFAARFLRHSVLQRW